MPHAINDHRAGRACNALAGYEGAGEKDHGGAVDGFTDLLSDLMHLCDENGWDFDDRVRMAREHFEAESGQPDDIEEDARNQFAKGLYA